jgi:MinD-like ATPase involved in chromosome partitioning or flagellar assembly
MEPFPDGKSIGEYLYYLFNEKEENAVPFLESFLVFDDYGVEAFSPSSGRNLLNSLSPEEMQYFISTLINTGHYDFILIDAGYNLSKSTMCCYEMANAIFLLENHTSSRYKNNRLLEYIMFLKGETIINRTGRIQMGGPGEAEKEETESMVQTICSLPYMQAGFTRENGLRRISLDGAYGLGIEKLARSILEHLVI